MGTKWSRLSMRYLPTISSRNGRVAENFKKSLQRRIFSQERILRHEHNNSYPIPDSIKRVLTGSAVIEGLTGNTDQIKPILIEVANLAIIRTGVNDQ